MPRVSSDIKYTGVTILSDSNHLRSGQIIKVFIIMDLSSPYLSRPSLVYSIERERMIECRHVARRKPLFECSIMYCKMSRVCPSVALRIYQMRCSIFAIIVIIKRLALL